MPSSTTSPPPSPHPHREFARDLPALNNLGSALREVRRFSEAIDAHRQAATVFQEVGDRYHEGGVLTDLGLALRSRGRLIKVGRAFVRARELLSEFEE